MKILHKKLFNLYITQNKTTSEVAKYFGCSRFPITKALKKFKIKTRNSGEATRKYEKTLTKKILKNGYYMNNLSLKEIADKYDIPSSKTVLTYFKIYKIPRRKIAIATKIRFNKSDMQKRFSKMRKGQNHWNFNNWSSREPYSKEWSKELKTKIRKRDNYTCQNCGITEVEHLIVYKEILTVHHIDYNKKNCKETNLVTVCKGCNTRANYNKDYWKEFYTKKLKG